MSLSVDLSLFSLVFNSVINLLILLYFLSIFFSFSLKTDITLLNFCLWSLFIYCILSLSLNLILSGEILSFKKLVLIVLLISFFVIFNCGFLSCSFDNGFSLLNFVILIILFFKSSIFIESFFPLTVKVLSFFLLFLSEENVISFFESLSLIKLFSLILLFLFLFLSSKIFFSLWFLIFGKLVDDFAFLFSSAITLNPALLSMKGIFLSRLFLLLWTFILFFNILEYLLLYWKVLFSSIVSLISSWSIGTLNDTFL